MNEEKDRKLEDLLKASFGPMNQEPKRDLWPAMLRRLEERPTTVPWYDWALIALVAVSLFFFSSGSIPVFLYHL